MDTLCSLSHQHFFNFNFFFFALVQGFTHTPGCVQPPAVLTNAGDPSNRSVFHLLYSIQKISGGYKTGFVSDDSALL